jgi:hypothetical protein
MAALAVVIIHPSSTSSPRLHKLTGSGAFPRSSSSSGSPQFS